MIVNKNELELTKEGIQFIKKLQKAKVEVEKMHEEDWANHIASDLRKTIERLWPASRCQMTVFASGI